MAITANEVKHVASLAKLEFTDEELQKFTGQMDEIINMVEQLGEVDTTDVPVTSKNVPEEKDGLIKVPAIIDESEEG